MNKRSDFEWDSYKDALNQEKHGVSFALAQLAFLIISVSFWRILSTAMMRNDSIALAGSQVELWPYGLPTVKTKSGLLAPNIGGKARKYMTAKIKYTDEPIGKVKVISDFLPSPEELALKDETVKVTIALSKTSIDFFKKEAKKYNTQYQKMIRRLLDEYSADQ